MDTLYTLTEDYQALLQLADDPDDEQAFSDTLEGIIGALDVKMDDYAAVLQNMGFRASMIDAEIKRLTARKKAVENSIQRMKDRLKESMKATDRAKVVTELHTFVVKKNGGKLPLIIDPDAKIPDKFCKVIVSPDMELIRKSLETGNTEVLAFANFGERGDHLEIK